MTHKVFVKLPQCEPSNTYGQKGQNLTAAVVSLDAGYSLFMLQDLLWFIPIVALELLLSLRLNKTRTQILESKHVVVPCEGLRAGPNNDSLILQKFNHFLLGLRKLVNLLSEEYFLGFLFCV